MPRRQGTLSAGQRRPFQLTTGVDALSATVVVFARPTGSAGPAANVNSDFLPGGLGEGEVVPDVPRVTDLERIRQHLMRRVGVAGGAVTADDHPVPKASSEVTASVGQASRRTRMFIPGRPPVDIGNSPARTTHGGERSRQHVPRTRGSDRRRRTPLKRGSAASVNRGPAGLGGQIPSPGTTPQERSQRFEFVRSGGVRSGGVRSGRRPRAVARRSGRGRPGRRVSVRPDGGGR